MHVPRHLGTPLELFADFLVRTSAGHRTPDQIDADKIRDLIRPYPDRDRPAVSTGYLEAELEHPISSSIELVMAALKQGITAP